jgi:hypothetical protein
VGPCSQILETYKDDVRTSGATSRSASTPTRCPPQRPRWPPRSRATTSSGRCTG